MVFNQLGDKAKLRRYRTNEAIALAMQGRWEEAVAVNASIVELFSEDVDAYNRLGKAFTQLGNYNEAKAAYGQALEIDPDNPIARRNYDRLTHLKNTDSEPKERKQVSSHVFIGETGKSYVSEMIELASQEVLAKMTAGDPVVLKAQGQRLIVESDAGEYIGEAEPRIALRLLKLIEGGNLYSGAIASIGQNTGKVMIREMYQHPSQAGKTSFPARANDEFRSYVKDSMLKYELEDDEDTFDDDSSDDWESRGPVPKKAISYDDGDDLTDDTEAHSDANSDSDLED